jgi:hypothetical protein
VGETTFLKNESYIPNIEENKSFIENLDFGVYWAVSVGVMLDSTFCTVGEKHAWGGWSWWCSKGHDKGYTYDPESDEEDDWGWPIPCDPNDKAAVKCLRGMEGAKDFYELSQVYLGAQYFAELAEKDPAFKGFVKAASSRKIPIIGVDKLPFMDRDEKYEKALKDNKVEVDDEGMARWVDDDGIVWVLENGERKALGIKAEVEETEEEKETEEEDTEEKEIEGEKETETEETEETEEGSEEAMPREEILACARKAGLPATLLDRFGQHLDENKDAVAFAAFLSVIGDELKEVTGLKAKADLGDKFLSKTRAEALSWYIKAHQDQDKPVDTKVFERILDRCGDDVELIEELLNDNKREAMKKYPDGYRRSTIPVDPNEPNEMTDPKVADGTNGKGKIDRDKEIISTIHRT